MIKRRYYRQDHGDRDNDDDSGSSSSAVSGSEIEAEALEGSEGSGDEQVAGAEDKENRESCSTSSGYESEESSAHEIDVDAPVLAGSINKDDAESEDDQQILDDSQLSGKSGGKLLEPQSNVIPDKEEVPADFPDCIIMCKSVFKCKLCPRIVCLTEETMRAHLKSKRHARSEKLFEEGRLRTMLNSDGEVENQETAMEMNARIVALGQDAKKKKDKNKGRQRQRMRLKRKNVGDDLNKVKKKSIKGQAKKRHKH